MTATLRRVGRFAGGLAFGTLVGLALAVVAPMAFGCRTLSVMSGSMAPTIDTGDAVVVRAVAPGSLRPGDVATFDDPEGTGKLITHRVRGVRHVDGALEVTTKGDANNDTERWRVEADGRVGRVVYHLPRVGFVLVPTASPAGRVALVALPTLVLGALGLRTIWRRPEAATATATTAAVAVAATFPSAPPARVLATLSPPLGFVPVAPHTRPTPAPGPFGDADR